MTKVFISYSRKDKVFAGRLTEALGQSELETWIDWEDIPPTADWMDQIHKGIEEADGFLFLLSPDSVASKICGQEVDHAVQNGKRLIPIVAREVNANDVHPALGKVNWIYCRESDDFDGAVNKTLSAIRTDLAWVESHRRLQVRAIEWERKNKENSFLLRGKDLQDAEQQLSLHATTDPQPTDLQREYVLKSRQVADKQRRLVTTLSIAAAVIMLGLAIFGFNQAVEATKQRNVARDNAATAVANSNIALARQLAAQAKALFLTPANINVDQTTAVLLAIQSMRLYPTLDSTLFLQQNTSRLPVIRLAQSSPITSVAFSQHGNYVAAGAEDGTIQVWEVAGWKEESRFIHNGKVTNIIFSPDGLHIITGSDDKTVRVWDIHSGKEIARVTHNDILQIVSVSPDGQYVLSSESCEQGDPDGFYCDIGSVRVWKTDNGEEILKPTFENFVLAAAFSPGGNYIAVGVGDGTVHILEIATGQETAQLNYGPWANSLAFDPTRDRIAVGGCERSPTSVCTLGSIRIWSSWDESFIEATEELQIPEAFRVTSLAFSSDGYTLVSRGEDGSVRGWNTEVGQELFNITTEDGIGSIAFSAEGHFLFSRGGSTARVWDASNGQEIARMLFNPNEIYSVDMSPDGSYLISGSADGMVQIWPSAPSPLLLRNTEAADVSFTKSGKYVIINKDGTTQIREIATGVTMASLPAGEEILDNPIPNVQYRTLMECEEGSKDNCQKYGLSVWDKTGQLLAHISQKNKIDCLVISPNGTYVASGDWEGMIRVWEVSTGKEVSNMSHEKGVWRLAFSPDSAYIVSGSYDYTARVWEAASGREIASMTHGSNVDAVQFSPDGKYVVSGSDDDIVQVWIWAPVDVIADACSRVSRNLTQAEWKLYIGNELSYQATCSTLPIESTATPTP